MADEQNNDEKTKGENRKPAGPNVPVREVVVKHLDEPPPAGKPSIHPRRPAPIVPTREERTREQPALPKQEDEDKDSKKPSSG